MRKLLIASLIVFAACDDGDILEHVTYQQEGMKVAVEAEISGIDSWTNEYTVTLSGFESQRNDKGIPEYSEISKQILQPKDGKLHITLGGVPQTVNYLEITVINRIRQRVITLWQHELTAADKNSKDTLRLDAGRLDVDMFTYIQNEYLTKSCANCHGLSERGAAAGLFLTEGKSHAAMVNVPSTKRAGINIVTPYDTAKSSLHLILWGNLPEAHHNHKDKLAIDAEKELIDNWILGGAK